MTSKNKRLLLVVVGLVVIGFATWLITMALQKNLSYYYTPTKVVNGEAPKGKVFRLGGMVVKDSIKRDVDTLGVEFVVTDYKNTIRIRYEGILPDMFKDQQATVTKGIMRPDGIFLAEEVLAKHDASYMPPEVADSLKKGKPVQQSQSKEDSL